MELKSGYTRTEIGVIPEDWKLRPFTSAVRIANGQMDPTIEPFRSMTLVAPDHIESGTGRLLKKETAADQCAISGKYFFASGDIVYSKIRPYLRKAMLSDFDGLCSADMYPLKPAADVSAGFVFASILGHRFSKYAESVSVRSGMPKINRAELAGYTLALPPTKSEQEAIADALSDPDALIESLEQLLAKKRQLKQGAMQELLTGKTRLRGFEKNSRYKQNESALVPEDWEITTLSQLSKLPMQNGLFFQPSRKGSGVKLINVGHLFFNAPIGPFTLDLFDATATEQDRFKVESGDLFFTRSSIVPSGIAQCNFYQSSSSESVVFDSHVIRFRPDTEKIVPSYLFRYCMASVARRYLVSKAKTGTMTTIDQSVLGKCPVFLPTISEQIAIAGVLADMDRELVDLEIKLDKVRQIKQAMMHKLLTGEIRLI